MIGSNTWKISNNNSIKNKKVNKTLVMKRCRYMKIKKITN